MKTRTRQIAVRIGLLVFSILVAAIVLNATKSSVHVEGQGRIQALPPSPGFPVKIGFIVPLSGDVQGFGESVRDGALIAVQQAQAAGWNIEIVMADSQCNSQEAVNGANHLIFDEGVNYLVGAVCSSASIPISEIAEANQVVQISPSSTNPQVTINPDGTNKEYVFRACFLDPFQGKVMAAVARDLGATKAAVLYDRGNNYVSALARYFKNSFINLGGWTPVYASYTSGQNDFSALLNQVSNANVDVLFLPDYFGRVNQIAEQANAMGLQTTFLGADGWDSPDLRLDLLEGAYFSAHFWPEDPRPVAADFVQTYNTTYGSRPDALAALGYDAMVALLEGISGAGVDNPSQVKNEMYVLDYEGATGKIAFNEFGDPLKEAAVVKIESGDKELVKYVSPVSGLAATNDSPTDVGNTTTFTASVTTGSEVTYAWAFGDGSTGSGPVATHTYATVGAYTAVVTASNDTSNVTAQTTTSVRETVEIAAGSVITTSDQALSMASPPALGQTLSVTYTPQVATTHATGDFALANITFHLEASYLSGGTLVIEPSEPLTLTLRYDEDALPAYLHEEELDVQRYDADMERWVALQVVSRDLQNDTITAVLDHFSEYALLGPVERAYLPLVMR